LVRVQKHLPGDLGPLGIALVVGVGIRILLQGVLDEAFEVRPIPKAIGPILASSDEGVVSVLLGGSTQFLQPIEIQVLVHADHVLESLVGARASCGSLPSVQLGGATVQDLGELSNRGRCRLTGPQGPVRPSCAHKEFCANSPERVYAGLQGDYLVLHIPSLRHLLVSRPGLSGSEHRLLGSCLGVLKLFCSIIGSQRVSITSSEGKR
jgi:hypothetical protein